MYSYVHMYILCLIKVFSLYLLCPYPLAVPTVYSLVSMYSLVVMVLHCVGVKSCVVLTPLHWCGVRCVCLL